jgi:spore maturation protein CgeB
MRFAYFTHSLLSDWNNGNAHFLRGIMSELITQGHEVRVYEPKNGWSRSRLHYYHGQSAIASFYEFYPMLKSIEYENGTIDLEKELDGVDVVIVHEWNDIDIVKKIGDIHKGNTRFRLLFHDTHHRALTNPTFIRSLDLSQFDGVLAFGNILRDTYLKNSWIQRAWTWHEAADTRIFKPVDTIETEGDVVWIGNWGDEERTAQLHEFLFNPVEEMKLECNVYGVRYPDQAQEILLKTGIKYCGWLPNYKVPQIFSRFRLTVHIPRNPYVNLLPGIPTIRVFEALACGIPLVCSPWNDCEEMFTGGKDYLVAQNGMMMKDHIRTLLNDRIYAREIACRGRETVLKKHTCIHRVDQLLKICTELGCGNK